MIDMIIPEKYFTDLLTNRCTLNVPDISQASQSHTYARQILSNKSNSDPKFPRLIDGDFLSGSYARGTKNVPLDDIDVMLPMDGEGLYLVGDNPRFFAGSGNADNPLLQHLDQYGLLSSRHIINVFHKALQKSYPTSTIKKNGQAVNVQMKYGFGIDIVPCFRTVAAFGGDVLYYIPQGGDSHFWMPTNPKIDAHISDILHKHHNEKLKPVIRLIKLWNDTSNNGRLRSYHVETMCWHVFYKYPGAIQHIGLAIVYFFQNALPYLQYRCVDATGVGEYVDDYLSATDRALSIRQLQNTSNTLSQVYSLGLLNEARQIQGFRAVYGKDFAI